MGFPGGSDGKESACDAGGSGSIPGWGRSPGDGNGSPLLGWGIFWPGESRGQRSLASHGPQDHKKQGMTGSLTLSLFSSLLSPTMEGFPHSTVVKESTCNAGDTGDSSSTPGWGRSPGGGNGSPLQCSCLGSPMGRGAWRATVPGVTGSQTQLGAEQGCV